MTKSNEHGTESVEWHQFQSDAGLQVRVRQEVSGDASNLVDLFEHLGAGSRYQRFSQVLDHPDPALVEREAQRLAALGPPQDSAWLAFADLPDQPNAPIAGARYVRTAADVAELAISVRDDLQRQGIGSQLLTYVLGRARVDGICKILGTFQSSNRAVWRLLHYSPFHVTWEINGPETQVVIYLQSNTACIGDS